MGLDNNHSLVISEHHQDQITFNHDHRGISTRGSDKGDLTVQPGSSTGDDPIYDQGMVMSTVRGKNLKVLRKRTSQIVKNMSHVQHGRSYRDVLTGQRQ